jgi:hypothetical protein
MKKIMGNQDGLSEEDLESIHKSNMEKAIALFEDCKRIKHDEIRRQYVDGLEKLIQEAFEAYQETNRIIRKAQESSKKTEAEMKKLIMRIAKKTKQLEISQEIRTNVMTKQLGYFSIRFVNETDGNITLYWKKSNFWSLEQFMIESKVTKICSFYAYDNFVWSTKYRVVILCGNKSADFWAFGEGAPREENIFTVKSDGIFLCDQKHSSWKIISNCTVKIVNETDSNITLHWQNYPFGNLEQFVIESKVTKICSFYAYDNFLWSTKCKAVIQYGNKSAEFWAFGQGAPEEENIFTVTSDGIFLCGQEHSSWKNLED